MPLLAAQGLELSLDGFAELLARCDLSPEGFPDFRDFVGCVQRPHREPPGAQPGYPYPTPNLNPTPNPTLTLTLSLPLTLTLSLPLPLTLTLTLTLPRTRCGCSGRRSATR